MTHALLLSLFCLGAEPSAADKFADMQIDKPFDRYLSANLLLMEATGAKILTLPNNNRVVVSVASTIIRNNSAADRRRAERVCQEHAFSYVVREQEGMKVFHVEESTDKTLIVNVDGKEHGRSVSEFMEMTKTTVEGIAKDMPVVGRWKSKDGEVFYLAIGAILNKKGNVVSGKVE